VDMASGLRKQKRQAGIIASGLQAAGWVAGWAPALPGVAVGRPHRPK